MLFYVICVAFAGLAMAGAASTPVRPERQFSLNASPASTQVQPQHQSGLNASPASTPVQPQHQCGLNASPASTPVWNSSLSVSAGAYGSNCVWKHSKGKYGENLFASSPSSSNHTRLAVSAVSSWVSEKKVADKNWKCMTGSPTCGHYTQVVWRKTTSVGCSIIHCPGSLSNFEICQYWPRGNMIGGKPY
ncbi:hypothetical protein Btru_027855 [Bulinus truncatus]|nr:hypothetical protein Btru_027855 [Bulinus truncatus]